MHTLFWGVQKYRCKYNDFKTFDDDNKSRTVGFHSLTSVAILPAVQLCVCRFCLYVGLCMTSVAILPAVQLCVCRFCLYVGLCITSVAILPAVQLCVCRFCLYVGLCMTSVELSHVLYLSDPMVTCQNAPRTCTLTGYST